MTQPTSNPVTVREAEEAFINEVQDFHYADDDCRPDKCEMCLGQRRTLVAAEKWVAAARAEAIEGAAKIPDEWANGPSCTPDGCTHKVMGYEVAKRIRALARKGVEP